MDFASIRENGMVSLLKVWWEHAAPWLSPLTHPPSPKPHLRNLGEMQSQVPPQTMAFWQDSQVRCKGIEI